MKRKSSNTERMEMKNSGTGIRKSQRESYHKKSQKGILEKTEKKKRWVENGSFCLFVFILIGSMYKLPSKQLKISFLDVGQGDGIVVEMPHGKTVTVDGGSSDVSAVGEYRILPFLKSERIQRIACAILTHMDKDHIGGIQELLEMEQQNGNGILIENLAVPAVLKEQDKWEEVKKTALEKGTGILYLKAGDRFEISGVQFLCMHPSEDFKDRSDNAASLVIKVVYGEFAALLTGDLEGRGEETFMKAYEEELREMDLLKVAHHGSKNSSMEAFLNICRPEISIISCGEGNRYGHPHKELLERLERAGSRIFITRDSGAVTVVTDGKQMRVFEYLSRKI